MCLWSKCIEFFIVLWYNIVMNIPFGESDHLAPESSLDILSEQAAFLQDISTLISELPSTQQASSENYMFTFPVLPLSTPYEMPAALKPLAHQIDDITIHIGDAHTPEYPNDEDRPAYVSVDITAGKDIYTFSRSGLVEGNNASVELRKIETSPEGEPQIDLVGTITKAEINSLLMSIALPNAIGDYSAYEDKELQSSRAFESLKELLSQKAFSYNESLSFLLKSGEVGVNFSREAGQLTSFTLDYYDEKQRLPVSVEYDIDSDFRLSFFGIGDGEKQVVIPTADEISAVRSLLRQEIAGLSARRLGFYDEEIVDDQSESQRRVVTNELTGQAEDVLNELGLNPPNPSA